ncbi:phosphatidylinositide phosphatase SAC2-like [Artemia franciscana]|uniref:phosphatidylinositide phosphatase SAC2-like n=1 Tax=Artemia franciscana TaxID=6661 RepID=UPI0032D9C088
MILLQTNCCVLKCLRITYGILKIKYLNVENRNLQNRKDFFIPIIQGYFETVRVPLFLREEEEVSLDPNMIPMTESVLPSLELTVISRRSRFRCGTRYLRRGVDENGYVANYVETEQIIRFSGHTVSFIQVRGSVPIYWSQPGYKYRPPPQLDKGELECQQAFKSHFNREVDTYGKICVVSLVEKIGKEKIIGDAFEKQILMHDSPDLAYAAFDFHDNCRGLRFENVELLVSALEEEMKAMKFSWIDSKGTICEQTGTFRVNCMDCLDRTNVVQMAVSRRVLLLILSKLGLVPPEGKVPESLLLAHQTLWANNGDAISKQYAGTNALKGDYTRTGKRKLAGMMKDGVNSASRFYINRFRDAFRQVAISILTGESIPNELLVSLTNEKTLVQDEPDITVTAERVKQVIEECRNLLLSDSEVAVGSWGVIDSHPASGDPTQTDMDLILIITQEMLYVIDYDDEDDELERYYPIPFANIEAIEFGPDVQGNISLNFLRGSSQRSRTQSSAVHHLKISYKIGNKSGYLVQCRSTRLRFFNNMAIPIKIDEEIVESLRAICETIVMTLEVHGYAVPVFYGPIVKRKGSIPIASGIPLAASTGGERGRSVLSQLGFNLSADTAAIVDAGSKALMNVTHQLARLSPSSIRRHLQSPLRSDSGRCASAMSHGAQVHYTQSRAPTPYFHYPFIEDVYVTTAGIIAVHSPKGDAAKVSSSSLAPKSKSPKLLKDTRRTTSFSNSGPMVVSRYTIPFEKLPEATPEIRISAPVQLPKVDMMLPLRDISGTDVGSRSSTPGSTILSALTSPLGRLSDSIVILSPNSGNPLTKIARGVQNLSNFDMRRSRPKPIELPEIQRLKLSSKTKFIEV